MSVSLSSRTSTQIAFFLPFALVCELDFLGHHRLHPHAHNTKLEVVSCILSQTTDRRVVISCPTRLSSTFQHPENIAIKHGDVLGRLLLVDVD